MKGALPGALLGFFLGLCGRGICRSGDACAVAADLVQADAALAARRRPHRKRQEVTVAVAGTASSTLPGVSGPDTLAYPGAVWKPHWRSGCRDVAVKVISLAKPRARRHWTIG